MKRQSSFSVRVTLKIEVDSEYIPMENAINEIAENMDYSFTYDEGSVRIIGTEIVDTIT